MFWHRGHELQSFSWLQMTGLPEELCSSFTINLISSTSLPHNRPFECLYKCGPLKWPRASTQDSYSSIPAVNPGSQSRQSLPGNKHQFDLHYIISLFRYRLCCCRIGVEVEMMMYKDPIHVRVLFPFLFYLKLHNFFSVWSKRLVFVGVDWKMGQCGYCHLTTLSLLLAVLRSWDSVLSWTQPRLSAKSMSNLIRQIELCLEPCWERTIIIF